LYLSSFPTRRSSDLFTIAEGITRKRDTAGAELDQFNVASRTELSTATLGVRPSNVLVPVSNYHALYHLAAVLDRVKTERRDIVRSEEHTSELQSRGH